MQAMVHLLRHISKYIPYSIVQFTHFHNFPHWNILFLQRDIQFYLCGVARRPASHHRALARHFVQPSNPRGPLSGRTPSPRMGSGRLTPKNVLIDSALPGIPINLFQQVKNDKNNHLWLYMVMIVWNISTFLYNIEWIFTNGSLRLQWLDGTCSWGVCNGPNSHQLAGRDCFVPWLAATPREPMAIACVNRSQQLLQHVYKFP